MADTPHKVDPIGERYFRPLEVAEAVADGLFYVSAALSLAVPLVSQQDYPSLYALAQILFALSVIALFAVTLAVRLYFSPRAQFRRFQDFLAHAFGKPLAAQQTSGYYNNAATTAPRRIAAQVLENSFYSHDTVAQMARIERIKIVVYVLLYVLVIFNRNTDLATIAVAAQIVFSEQIVSRWFRLEWLRRECERTYDDVYRQFQTKGQLDAFAIEAVGRYEIAKATAAISLSSRIFNKSTSRTDAEWAEIRAALGL
ncbi:hypothetical protein MTR72_24050 [Bradyrhizobium sp. ISRA442]|uniref:hypothetical protein n=1 Tax=Bradyrhizobium sp. ISRA442 TaxID=2866197 RepID=UPI00311B030D